MPDESKAVPLTPRGEAPILPPPPPLSLRMYEFIYPILKKYAGSLSIAGVDITYGQYFMGQQVVAGYALIVTARGPLLTPDNMLTHVHLMANRMPTEDEAIKAVMECVSKINEQRAAQLAQQQ